MQSTCLTSEARCATLCHDGLEQGKRDRALPFAYLPGGALV